MWRGVFLVAWLILAGAGLALADDGSAGDFVLAKPFAPPHRVLAEPSYPYGGQSLGRLPHHGVDFVNPTGAPVLAVGAGQVVWAGTDDFVAFGPHPRFYGNLVVTRLELPVVAAPVFALYGHLRDVAVTSGQMVRQGQVLGHVGQTGVATGPHLHLEIRTGQNTYADTRNPELWLGLLPGNGSLVGQVREVGGAAADLVPVQIYRLPDMRHVWHVTATYAPDVPCDERRQENFTLADVPAGKYRLKIGVGEQAVWTTVAVLPGQVTSFTVELSSIE